MAGEQITDVAIATAVISQAIQHKIYPGEMPETDEQKIAVANEYFRLAQDAAKVSPGEAVNAVLAAATGQAPAPQAPPAADPPPAPPVAAPAPPPPPAPVPVDPPKVVIKAPDGTEYMVEANQVQQYVDGGYEVVGQIPPQQTPPTPPGEPAQQTPSAPEPWEGYATAKIPDIVAHIENLVLTQGEEAKPMLAVVWEYENQGKKRTRLLSKLQEIATNGVQVKAPEPTPPAPPMVEPPAPPVAAAPPVAPPLVPGEGDDVRTTSPFVTQTTTNGTTMEVTPVAPLPAPPAPGSVAQPSFDEMVSPFADQATSKAQTAIAREHLPIPQDAFAAGDPPQIPADFTVLGDVDIARYQSQFNACYARAHYLLAISEGHSSDAKIVGDGAVRKYIDENRDSFPKGITVTEMEARASQSPEVQHARRVQHEWSEHGRQLRHLGAIYQTTCERLSREQTRRDNDKQLQR